MAVFEIVLVLLFVGVLFSLWASRLGLPWPVLLALVGAGAAFIPGVPTIALDPELALALFLAPILFAAGYATSVRDVRQNWVPVGGLVVFAVGVTTIAVAMIAHRLVPGMSWPVAVALGAIVAPPDAAAATAVLRQVRLPHRMMVILEGESLLNDATALLVFRSAVGAVAGGFTLWTAPLLILSVIGGAVLGGCLAFVYDKASARLEEKPARIVLQFVSCCGVWLIAEAVGVSAVLAIVGFAIVTKRLVRGRASAHHRRNIHAVWEVAIFVLNVLAFILVGLQLRGIVERLPDLKFAGLFAAAVLITAVLTRLAWVVAHAAMMRKLDPGAEQSISPVQSGLIGWCGLRGIVTLAAALALPIAFPHRDLIVFTAFIVVLGTLVIQGLTLRPMLARLTLGNDDIVERECCLARTEGARAVLAELDGHWTGPGGYLVHQDYRARLSDRQASDVIDVVALRRKAFVIERRVLLQMLRQSRIGDDCFHRVEEALDWADAGSGE